MGLAKPLRFPSFKPSYSVPATSILVWTQPPIMPGTSGGDGDDFFWKTQIAQGEMFGISGEFFLIPHAVLISSQHVFFHCVFWIFENILWGTISRHRLKRIMQTTTDSTWSRQKPLWPSMSCTQLSEAECNWSTSVLSLQDFSRIDLFNKKVSNKSCRHRNASDMIVRNKVGALLF